MKENAKVLKTAIFYDVENLIGGYNIINPKTGEWRPKISMTKLFNIIKTKSDSVGDIVAQYAYANWERNRTKKLRPELFDLNIKCIDLFGIKYGYTKNLADFHVVIDCISFALIDPSIENYILVSGDGGFSVVANYLKQRGKRVIGCSLKHAKSMMLEQVCDEFIEIDEQEITVPFTEEEVKTLKSYNRVKKYIKGDQLLYKSIKSSTPHLSRKERAVRKVKMAEEVVQEKKEKASVLDIAIKELSKEIQPFSKNDYKKLTKEVIHNKISEVFHHMILNEKLVEAIKREGIPLYTLKSILSFFFSFAFDYKMLGYKKFVNLVIDFTRATSLTIFRNKYDNYIVGYQNEKYTSCIEIKFQHSVEVYRKILNKSKAYPLPQNRTEVYDVLVELIYNPETRGLRFNEMAKVIVKNLKNFSMKKTKNVLKLLMNTGCFEFNKNRYQSPLKIKSNFQSEIDILEFIRKKISQELKPHYRSDIEKMLVYSLV